MMAWLRSPHSTASSGHGVRGVLEVAPRSAAARFAGEAPQPGPAQPGPAAAAPQPADHPTHQHPVHKPHRNNMPLIFILGTVGVIVVFVAVVLVMRSTQPTFADLKVKLANAAALTPSEFRKIATIESESDGENGHYIYFTVREGRAEVVVDRDAWNRNQVQIKSQQLFR